MSPTRAGRRVAVTLVGLFAGILMLPMAVGSIAQPWRVEGHSMEPALSDGSLLLVDAVGPRVAGYGRGDIVVLPVPRDVSYPERLLVKRVVAVAGDRVLIAGGRVAVNGRPLPEPYLRPGTTTTVTGARLELVVPAGSVFVLGDHRENSFDSKAFGPVPISSIVGRAWLAVGPNGGLELPGAAAAQP